MEPDDKEHSSSASYSLLAHSLKAGRSLYTLNLSKLMFFLALLALGLLYSNLIFACATAFTCHKFLPTPDYLGCFRGHDRLHIVFCTFTSVLIIVVLIGTYTRFRSVTSGLKRGIMLILGSSAALSLPSLAMTDEVNAVHTLPFERIHSLFGHVFVVSSVIWVLLAYSCVSALYSMLNAYEKKWFFALRISVVLMVFLVIGVVAEARFAYTVYTSKYLNENVEATLEWVLAGLGIVLLTLFCQFIRGFGVIFAVQTKDPGSDKSEVELTKI